MNDKQNTLILKYLGIDTYKDPVIYIRSDSYVCKSEGFEAQARVQISLKKHTIVATLHIVESNLLPPDMASLSIYAWNLLTAQEGDEITISHPKPLQSLSYIRSKVYGNELKFNETKTIIEDIVSGQLSDIHIAMFIAACTGIRMSKKEIINLTKTMVDAGQQLTWPSQFVMDKHCVGGLPGNRTTPIIVPIIAEFGLTIPKTSARAITSPAGTADTMEVFAPVNLDIAHMHKVVEKENGCIVWGRAAHLSPADDLLIRIERTANLDSESQLVASILSKKIASGATHLVIDMPIGPTAKVRTSSSAKFLKNSLESTAKIFGMKTKIIFTDGLQPVGRGIGPALEATDILAVLKCDKNAPQDLRERSLTLAGHILEFSPQIRSGEGKLIATEILNNGKAFLKFQAICNAQGGMREIPKAPFTYTIEAQKSGLLTSMDNRQIARIAKLAGAPYSKSAGIELFVKLNTRVSTSQPLFTIHAETRGELNYVLDFIKENKNIFQIEENK